MALRTVVALASLLALSCDRAEPTGSPVAPASASNARAAGSPLAAKRRSVEGREYLELTGGELSLALSRPDPSDNALLLAVPGTYTSPAGAVEGAVIHDGRVVQEDPLDWEALLVIDAGRPSIRWQKQPPDREQLAEISRRAASALQGHLLVGSGAARPLKPSPALRRRAIVIRERDFAIVESLSPLELARFADDLLKLGARHAMNLDMGRWSEGWYRRSNGTLARLGDDFRATDRQTNWLVLRTR